MEDPVHEGLVLTPLADMKMYAVASEAVPVFLVAYILRKQHFHVLVGVRKGRQRSGYKAGAGRGEHMVLGPEHVGDGFYHRLHPLRMLVSPDAIPYDCIDEWVPCCCGKGIVPDLPIHPVLVVQEAVQGQALEREHTTEFKQIVETGGQEQIGVKVEAAETIYRQISEQVVALNPAQGTS